ncbi:hypothetical protein [Helicobacter rodentium]|uniref:hypothetical protein n=1 Tax=Helicobacter rodentium TaxID=59617 RepID=UPI0026183511|nr:hypothetical protein [Helicobacter rodentium]
MAIVILKTNAGMNFHTSNGTVSLNGFCVLNEVSDEELKALKSNNSFNDMVKNGFAEITNKANRSDAHEIASEVVREQGKAQNAKTRNIKRKPE